MTNPTPWNVLLTIPNFDTAGSGQALVNVAQRLDPNHFKPVVGVRRISGARLERELADAGIELIEIDLAVSERPYPTLAMRARRAARELRRRKIALVHSFDYRSTFTEALAVRSAGSLYVSTKKNMAWGSRAWPLRSLLSHRIAVQNEEMFRQFFKSWIYRDRLRYIPRGVVIEHFASGPSAAEARRTFGLPDDAVVVGSVASIQDRKNQLVLVEALPDQPNVHLLLAGPTLDDDYRAAVEALAASRGLAERVHLVGALEDVRPALAASDVFALVSKAEGSPVALIEAMCTGLPLVASRIPGIREFLEGSDAALLVDPMDLSATRSALQRLCEDTALRTEMGDAASALVRMRRSIDLEVARTESLYLELLWRQ